MPDNTKTKDRPEKCSPVIVDVHQELQIGRGAFVEKVRIDFGDHREVEKYRINERDVAVLIPVTEEGKLLLLRQWRSPPNRGTERGKWMWEFPAGTFNEGEDPEEAGKRELLEETGYTAQSFESIGTGYQMAPRTSLQSHYFIARGAKRSDAGQHLDDDETIEVYEFTPEEIIGMWNNHEIDDVNVWVGVLYYTSVVEGRSLKGMLRIGKEQGAVAYVSTEANPVKEVPASAVQQAGQAFAGEVGTVAPELQISSALRTEPALKQD